MENLIRDVHRNNSYLFEDLASPITKDWFLAGNPLKIAFVLSGYLLFVLKIGPWFMKTKTPYNLKNVLNVFNVLQIIFNLYIFYESTIYIFFTDFNFYCHGLNDPNTPTAVRIASAVWLYYMVKVSDLLDTVFFVLKKSDRQISILHVWHHSVMPLFSWYGVTFYPGGQSILIGYLNTLIHAIMYTYYLIAGLGDEYKKYLWWKRHLTTLQLIQFVIGTLHSFNSLFYKCSYPEFLKILTIMNGFIFITMFSNFFYQNYMKTKKIKE